jgi:host factor-I protein
VRSGDERFAQQHPEQDKKMALNEALMTKSPAPRLNGGSIQHNFLAQMVKERQDVAIYLTSGIRLEGKIMAADQYVILLERETIIPVYKHAVASVVPVQRRQSLTLHGFEGNRFAERPGRTPRVVYRS